MRTFLSGTNSAGNGRRSDPKKPERTFCSSILPFTAIPFGHDLTDLFSGAFGFRTFHRQLGIAS